MLLWCNKRASFQSRYQEFIRICNETHWIGPIRTFTIVWYHLGAGKPPPRVNTKIFTTLYIGFATFTIRGSEVLRGSEGALAFPLGAFLSLLWCFYWLWWISPQAQVQAGSRKPPSRAGTKRLGVDETGQYTYKKVRSSIPYTHISCRRLKMNLFYGKGAWLSLTHCIPHIHTTCIYSVFVNLFINCPFQRAPW